jgi:hypothetical protein
MLWCLTAQALLLALLGLAALRLRLPHIARPLRNGLVTLLTLAALGLLGVALRGAGS